VGGRGAIREGGLFQISKHVILTYFLSRKTSQLDVFFLAFMKKKTPTGDKVGGLIGIRRV